MKREESWVSQLTVCTRCSGGFASGEAFIASGGRRLPGAGHSPDGLNGGNGKLTQKGFILW